MSELFKCSRRGCGWIGTLDEQRQEPIDHSATEGRCPRCNCNSFYKAKPGDLASSSILPAKIAEAKFFMICTGESYSTKIVDGARLHVEWATAIYGSIAECPAENLQHAIETLKDFDNWRTDPDFGPICYEEDVGETDHIAFWRLT